MGGGAFGAEFARRVTGRGIEGEGAAVAMAGRRCFSCSVEGASGAGLCGGRRVTKDEELDEGTDQEDDGKLAEEEALGEREPVAAFSRA